MQSIAPAIDFNLSSLNLVQSSLVGGLRDAPDFWQAAYGLTAEEHQRFSPEASLSCATHNGAVEP